MARLLIVSGVRIYREGLREALMQSELAHAVDAAGSLAETLDYLNRTDVDALLLDTGTLDALSFIKTVCENFRDTKVVAFGLSDSRDEIMAYAEAGISGFVSKESSVDDLIRVLEGAVRGELECPADIAGALLRRVSELATQKRAKQTNPDLTPREWEVAHLIGDGFTNKEIASSLDIRVPTAKAHVHQVLAKLGARRRWEVVSRLPDAIAQNRCGKDASARPS